MLLLLLRTGWVGCEVVLWIGRKGGILVDTSLLRSMMLLLGGDGEAHGGEGVGSRGGGCGGRGHARRDKVEGVHGTDTAEVGRAMKNYDR